jgi:ubiquinone biosynthesis protein
VDLLLDLSRVLVLVRVAVRHGGALLAGRVLGQRVAGHSPAVRLRLALEELGLTYLKLGQYLSTRFDVLPRDVCQELTRLLEHVSPIDPTLVRPIVEAELGAPLEAHFSRFQPEPLASASVAQVHEAYTRAGERVAVKIQRPGIERIFAADVRNLRRLAGLLDAVHAMGSLSVREMVDVFEGWTSRELDFRTEGATADRLRAEAIGGETVPAVHWALTTRRVLTLEFVEGVSLTRVMDWLEQGRTDELDRLLPNLDVPRVGHLLATACLHQMFGRGFFHGDPHPGNIIVRPDNSIAFVDFGIFGQLSTFQRDALAGLMESIAIGEADLSFRYYAKQTIPSPDTDFRRFSAETTAVFRAWYEASRDPSAAVEERHLGRFSAEMFDVVRRNHVRMTTDTLLFWRAMNILAATAVRLPEHFDLLGEVRGFFLTSGPSWFERLADAGGGWSPDRASRDGQATLGAAERLGADLVAQRVRCLAELHPAGEPARAATDQARQLAAVAVGLSLLLAATAPALEAARLALTAVGALLLLRQIVTVVWR